MLESVPFIHTFRTSGGDYIYDVNKNTIVKTQKSVYEFLNNLSKDNIKQSLESNTKEVFGAIENLVTEGFLSSNKLSEIVHPMDEFLVDCLNNKVRMITLQVTQQCNLRCSYCVYSDNYQTREHSNRRMDFEIARKGIDFIISHSKDLSHINIGFYGGEPILEFEMIKRCISYAEEKAEGKFVTFNMTTNGTLINEEVIEYFQEHNVSILISLDGPKSIHDKNRVFASNGQGSFDRIIANIENIREKYPEYSKNITFNIVLDPENNFSCIN
ncbi:MAG: radical SAM protein, partial [Bacillota bacterium]